MAVTLNEMKVGKVDKIYQKTIDTFIRKSPILAVLPFENCVSTGGIGSTMTYGYTRTLTSPAAGGRTLNTEYTASEATKEALSTTLVIRGGKFEMDRVIGQADPDQLAYQVEQKVEATSNDWHNLFINGNKDTTNEFDGLAQAVDGTTTDIDASSIDCSTMTSTVAIALTEAMDEVIASMKRKPDAILANSKAIIKMKSAARALGYLTPVEDGFGKSADGYDGIPFIDMGRYYNTALGRDTEVIGIDDASGKTDVYFVCFGLDEVVGVTLNGDRTFNIILPDLTTSGAVKAGEVEIVSSIAVKDTRAVGRLENLKVKATLTTLGSLTVTVANSVVSIAEGKAKIGNKYYYKVDTSASVTAPTANTALNTSAWTALPANGAITINANNYLGVVEVDSTSLLPVNFGQANTVS